MEHHDINEEIFKASPLLILLTYTLLSVALAVETILMSWEVWVIPLIAVSIMIGWGLHVSQFMSIKVRLWIYTFLMMASFFFYGIHTTSTYDMPLLMMLIIMIYTTTGDGKLILTCQLTYFFTLAYDIVLMINDGTEWDRLLISRTVLHIVLMMIAGWMARVIVRKWSSVFHKSDERIKELNESTERMNSFMANLSHELRTPINAILGITNVMLYKEENEELKADMRNVIVAGHRMAEQVGDILDYSEIEMDCLVVNKGNYMIASVLNDLVTEIRPIIPQELELVMDVDSDVPAVLQGDGRKLHKLLYHLISNGLKYTKEGGVCVRITSKKQSYGINLCIEVSDTGIGMTKDELDRIYNRFYQAESGRVVRAGGLGISMVIVSGFVKSLGGFITIDSEPGKGTTVRVSIPQGIEDEEPCMSVDDREVLNLVGFLNIGKFPDPNVREFYNSMILNLVRGLKTTMHRVDNIEDLKKLTEKIDITHLFVADEEYLKNRDYIESLASGLEVVIVAKDPFTLPKNSKAHVLLKPFYCIPVVSILNFGKKTENEEKQLFFRDVKALVVDDEPMNLMVAKGILNRYGMQVVTADSGQESVRLCKEQSFDIVFMDHMMPGMDGVEAMKRIRYDAGKARKEFPIVALTANALSTAKEMFLSEGFDGFISKPVEMRELERVLKRVLPENVIYFEETEKRTVSADSGNSSQEGYGKESGGQVEEKSDPADKAVLLEACGINRAMGIGYCNDENLYDMLLEQFADEADEKRARMEKSFKDKDLNLYMILVHALKSTSLMIGNQELSEKAKALEKAAKEKNIDYIRANHGAMMEQYRQVTDSIIKAFGMKFGSGDDSEADILEFEPDGEENDILEFAPCGEDSNF